MNDPVRDLAGALSGEGALKLWSVLVSCLGDARRSGTEEVSGRVLSALVGRIGLQPQAMRVALHRLKRDGWVSSRRDGRVGFHRLTDEALARTLAVSDRIYGPSASPEAWHLAGLPPDPVDGLDLLPDGIQAVPVSRDLAVVAGGIGDLPGDWLVATPSDRPLPGWMRDLLADAACEAAFGRLRDTVSALGPLPDDPLDRFALRVLALHGWRRLILRSNPAAEAALGAQRAEVACRAEVHDLLDRLGPAGLSEPVMA